MIATRCEEVGRDPATLRISVNIGRTSLELEGQERVDLLGAYRDLGVKRVMGLLTTSVQGDAAIASLAADATVAGVTSTRTEPADGPR